MLKFIKHHIDTISGIEIYPIIGLIIFFTFFIGLIWFVIKEDKQFILKMKNLPISDGCENNKTN